MPRARRRLELFLGGTGAAAAALPRFAAVVGVVGVMGESGCERGEDDYCQQTGHGMKQKFNKTDKSLQGRFDRAN